MMAKRLVQKGIDVPPGSRLEYVFVKGEGKQGDKMMTPDEVRDNGLQIDPFFYIEKQLLTQLDDVLEVIGISGYIRNRYIVC
jgi:DNA polymerase I